MDHWKAERVAYETAFGTSGVSANTETEFSSDIDH
jgi:hypothetical protein